MICRPDASILGFIQFLRNEDFRVSTSEAALIGRALATFAEPDRLMSRNLCRAVCCQRIDDWRRFDALFDDYWSRSSDTPEALDDAIPAVQANAPGGVAGIGTGVDVFKKDQDRSEGYGAGAGRQTTLARADFRFLTDPSAMRHVERLAERLAKQLRRRRSRRKIVSRRTGSLAVRQTLRAGIRTAGIPVIPWYSMKRNDPPGIVVLHDVSHSMTFNNPLLFRFSRGLIKRCTTAEAFVFHTRLFRVTPVLRESSLTRMRELLEQKNHLWLGGTCIADSLAEFRQKFAAQVLKSHTNLIVISDGIDSNEPERLAVELGSLKRQCQRVIWLNPMLERAGFNPHKESVRNIRRNVDKLLPAHSLEALQRCIQAVRG